MMINNKFISNIAQYFSGRYAEGRAGCQPLRHDKSPPADVAADQIPTSILRSGQRHSTRAYLQATEDGAPLSQQEAASRRVKFVDERNSTTFVSRYIAELQTPEISGEEVLKVVEESKYAHEAVMAERDAMKILLIQGKKCHGSLRTHPAYHSSREAMKAATSVLQKGDLALQAAMEMNTSHPQIARQAADVASMAVNIAAETAAIANLVVQSIINQRNFKGELIKYREAKGFHHAVKKGYEHSIDSMIQLNASYDKIMDSGPLSLKQVVDAAYEAFEAAKVAVVAVKNAKEMVFIMAMPARQMMRERFNGYLSHVNRKGEAATSIKY